MAPVGNLSFLTANLYIVRTEIMEVTEYIMGLVSGIFTDIEYFIVTLKIISTSRHCSSYTVKVIPIWGLYSLCTKSGNKVYDK